MTLATLRILFGRLLPWAVLLFLFVPMLVVIPVSLTDREYLSLPDQGLSIRHYETLLSPQASWLASIGTSAWIAIVAAAVATGLGAAYSMGAWSMRGAWPTLTRVLLLAPMIVPPIVFAVGIFRVYAWLGLLDHPLGVVIVHIVLCIPFSVLAIGASLANLDPRLVQAARSLGAKPPTVFWRVILPNLLPGLMASAVFAFITSWDEITVTLFITSRAVVTLPRQIWTGIADNVDPVIAAVGAVILIVTMVALVLRLLTGRDRTTSNA